MRKFLLVMVMGLCTQIINSQSVYSISLNDIDGVPINLSSYQGKKIVFVIAHLNVIDSNKLKDLGEFVSKYDSSVRVIGIISKDEGYADSLKNEVKNLYDTRGINIVLTQPIHTKAIATTTLSPIFEWLTKRMLNGRFDIEYLGVGQKFIADKNGKLITHFIAETKFNSPAVEQIIKRKF